MEECRPAWCECLPRPAVWRLAGGWPPPPPPPPPPRPGPAHTSSGLQTRGCVASVTHSVLTVCGVCVCVCECGGCSPVSVCRLCAGRCSSLAWLGWAGWAAGRLGGLGGRRGDCSLLASRCCPRHQPRPAAGCCWHVITAAQSVGDRAVHGSRLHHRHGQHAAKHTPASSL